jgi:phage gp45-like
MVHRQTGAASAYRGYDGGGARALVDKIDDGPLMQTMTGQGMKGESFSPSSGGGKSKGPESPQNYGFTSVVADATKGANGMIKQCAEGFMSFIGGNRSFPVCAMMDDRRHRLKNLAKDAAKGAVSMFGQKEWGQQYLNTEDGQFITGNMKKKNRMQLVENKNGQKAQQQPGSSSGGAQAAQASVQALDGSSRELVAQAIRNAEGRLVIQSKSGVEFEIEEFVMPPQVTTFADGGGGGGGAAGGGDAGGGAAGGQGKGDSKPTGQKTLHKEDTQVYVEQNGTDTTSRHGEGFASQKGGSDSSTHWEKDKKKSTQCTDEHVHIRYKDHRIFNDKGGNWATSPIQIKMDKYCKEG